MEITMTSTAKTPRREVEPRVLLVHFLRDHRRAHRHPLGMRHVELRRLHRLARRHSR